MCRSNRRHARSHAAADQQEQNVQMEEEKALFQTEGKRSTSFIQLLYLAVLPTLPHAFLNSFLPFFYKSPQTSGVPVTIRGWQRSGVV